jgi:hypothetical protein
MVSMSRTFGVFDLIGNLRRLWLDGDGLYVMQLVVVATNQNALYKKHKFCRKNVNKIKMYVYI